jgi:3-hydroxybutyryl-CoA dehydratase
MDINAIYVGHQATCDLTVTAADVDAFARLSLDTNPIHLDPAVARDFGFSRAVAHGMLALGSISRLIGTSLPGPGALWVAQDVRFVGPVFVGDALTARVEVEQVSRAAGVVVLHTEVICRASGATVLSGTARVKVLERRPAADAPHGAT